MGYNIFNQKGAKEETKNKNSAVTKRTHIGNEKSRFTSRYNKLNYGKVENTRTPRTNDEIFRNN